tara:strand:+ start:1031 stop:1252 length:222 start_codon:yes stop_codon:yes gene_type:complete
MQWLRLTFAIRLLVYFALAKYRAAGENNERYEYLKDCCFLNLLCSLIFAKASKMGITVCTPIPAYHIPLISIS